MTESSLRGPSRIVLSVALLLVGALVASMAPATGAPGDVDTGFGTAGKITHHFDLGADERVRGLVVQPDGKIVVAVYDASSNAGVLLARFTRNGAIDTTFSGDGRLSVDMELTDTSYAEEPSGIALLPDGKIVVGGYTKLATQTNRSFFVIRVRPNGSLDTTYSGDGRAFVHGIGDGCCPETTAMALQPDGKVVLVGYAEQGAEQDLAVVRFRANGTADAAFGSAGIKLIHVGGPDQPLGVAVADKKIYVAGRSQPAAVDELLIMRLKSGGSLDPTFGSGGTVTDDLAAGSDEGRAVAVQPDGKVVVAGTNSGADPVVVRYLPSGARDSSFGSGGVVFPAFSGADLGEAFAVLLHTGGTILVGGQDRTSPYDDFMLLRLTRSGKADPNFSGDGRVTIDFEEEDDHVTAMALQGEKVVLAGESQDADASSRDAIGLARVKGRDRSATSLRVRKRRSQVVAKGAVKPNHRGKRVIVTMFKRKSGKFVKVASKRVRLTTRSRYRTAFGRRAPGRCRITTTFPGDVHHMPSSARRAFRC